MIKLIIDIYIHIAAALLYAAMIIICRTLRVEVHGKEGLDELKKRGKNAIFAVWHQATFVMFHLYRRRETAIFVTSEVRGQVLGKCAEWMGYKALPIHLGRKITMARSTARLLNYLQSGHDAVIAVDGPTGPLHEIKPGVFYLGEKTGTAIIPVGIKTSRKITLAWRWDKYFVPLPFSRVEINLGKPIKPEELKKTDLKRELEKLSA